MRSSGNEPSRYGVVSRLRALRWMRTCAALFMLSVWVLSGLGCARDPQQTVTLQSCLQDLTNVNVFAQTPLGQAGMIGTFDPTGGNSDWAQWTQDNIGSDGLITLADLKGPGKITRIWQASVPTDAWLFFFDGEKIPRLSASHAELFGGVPPFEQPLATFRSGECYHSYFPFPFEKSLRIAIRPKKWFRPYYQINYELYPRGVKVESYPSALSPADLEQAVQTARHWRENDEVMRNAAMKCDQHADMVVDAGGSFEWLRATGPGQLNSFTVRVDVPDGLSPLSRSRLWRQLVIRFWWDGEDQPSVDVPLGDFFCNAFHRREFSSLAVAYLDGAYICRFPMPFAKSARAEIRNDSSLDVSMSVDWRLTSNSNGFDFNYFHARWNSATSRGGGYNLLTAEGQGHYVGCFLLPIGMDGSWFIVEADDYTFINGEAKPLIQGCGLEDYFNGAWYYLGLFDLPLSGLTEKAPVHLEQYRFMLGDPIAFQDGISANWEFGHANKSKGYMSSVAYWYQTEPQPADSVIASGAGRHPPLDPIRPAGLMCHLFELERVGEYAAARERCLEFVEAYPQWPYTPLVDLRANAYHEKLAGVEVARGALARYLASADTLDASVVAQAKALEWLYAGESNAVVGAHAAGEFVLYIDGQQISRGEGHVNFPVVPIRLSPGTHEISAEVVPAQMDPWFSMCLRSRSGSVRTDGKWESTDRRPDDWPHAFAGDTVRWSKVTEPLLVDMLPRSTAWQLMPNAFIGMQSAMQLLRRVKPGWDRRGKRATYLRRRFTITEEDEG